MAVGRGVRSGLGCGWGGEPHLERAGLQAAQLGTASYT
eukprot:CAMPEP_0181199804 /NCGR_PEP_ID=MMETSP1096-20121128/17384_1 /TAXON_ID=156174 ORGANISM="Chrysochromulina ericina, Strain CCMP281" /NCGR_SAMPLE_ID=MMETSP1096 /ASSEMBLY_ACC=CAM_ASM_000453 /LENGTH=37 /DNA_ID= /DNA_START= /DNA_END= /DNA_ORIENTATION=